MAKPNISLLGATYSGVSGVSLPKSGGGTATFPWVEGSQTVTENNTYNVTNLAELVVNVSGGGGPTETDAVLLVNAPSGSTVTATKGGTTLVPTLWVASDGTEQAMFVFQPADFGSNPWTVTATSGSNTSSKTVVVNENKAYNISLNFAHYLIKNGVLQSGYTAELYGGGEVTEVDGGTGAGYLQYHRATGGGNTTPRGFYISPAFDFSAVEHSKLYIDFAIASCYTGGYASRYPTFGAGGTAAVYNNYAQTYSAYSVIYSGASISSLQPRTTVSCSIGSLSGSYYPKVILYNSNDRTVDIRIYNLWSDA